MFVCCRMLTNSDANNLILEISWGYSDWYANYIFKKN